jgi:hypothetical protein
MSWGTRRRNTIIFIVVLVVILPAMIGGFLFFYDPPNCFDGKKNGSETGVDCGGSCELLCTEQTKMPVVVWERFFRVSPGVYNVVAYVENQNPSAGVMYAPYIFQIFNQDNVLIGEREGSTRLYANSIMPVIETNINTFKQVPFRVSFQWTNDLVFEKEPPVPVELVIQDERYFVDNIPKVTAKVKNITLKNIDEIRLIVLLYDTFNNVIGSSSTVIEELKGEESKDITFTWPIPFAEEVSRIEIVPIYEPDF